MEEPKPKFTERVSGLVKKMSLGDNGNFIKKLKAAIAILGVGVFVTLGIVCVDHQDRKKEKARLKANKAVADSTARAIMDSTIRAVVNEMIVPIKQKVDLHDRILYREGITGEPSRPVHIDTQKVYEQFQSPKEKK